MGCDLTRASAAGRLKWSGTRTEVAPASHIPDPARALSSSLRPHSTTLGGMDHRIDSFVVSLGY